MPNPDRAALEVMLDCDKCGGPPYLDELSDIGKDMAASNHRYRVGCALCNRSTTELQNMKAAVRDWNAAQRGEE